MKKTIICVFTICTILLLGRSLNPLSKDMFEFHDETQPARIQQFVLNLKQGQIPPRMAPDFSFKLGYPVFNFYAPAAYWITGSINLIGVDVVNSIKLSYILAICASFIFSFLFLQEYFDFYPSLLGSVLYITSLYLPIDIFVRGNLAETWFLATVPLTLYAAVKLSKKPSRMTFFVAVSSFFFVLTVHNLLSFLFLPILLVFIIFQHKRKMNFLALFFALLLGAYFFLPLAFETRLTYASQLTKLTKYQNHFLCMGQLWDSPWGFGGSTSGCIADGQSFKLGKPQVILFFIGVFIFIFGLLRSKHKDRLLLPVLFFIVLTLGSLFLTIYQSKFIWDSLSPIMSLIQFPWRFISFSMVGLVFLSTYAFQKLPKYLFPFLSIIISLSLLVITSRYFTHRPMDKKIFEQKYLSKSYIQQSVAYKIAEYLPRTVDYSFWRELEQKPNLAQSTSFFDELKFNNQFEKEFFAIKSASLSLPIIYFPYWQIFLDHKSFVPTVFDKLGRPLLTINHPTIISIAYNQTTVEKLGNLITLTTFVLLVVIMLYKPLWKHMK